MLTNSGLKSYIDPDEVPYWAIVGRDKISLMLKAVAPKFLNKNNYTFWRFMQIFFYSDARKSELLRVRK